MIIDISNSINIYKKNKLISRNKYTKINDIDEVLDKYERKKVYLLLNEKLYKEKDKFIRKNVIIKERPLIETKNSNLLTNNASGNLIINFYKEYTGINLISLNNIIKYDIYKYSYTELIKIIKEIIKKKLKYDFDIYTCELIYSELYINNREYIEVEGHKVKERKMSKIKIKESHLNKCINDYLSKLMEETNKFLEKIYPVLKRDIMDTGIVIYSNYLNQGILDRLSSKYKINLFYINDDNNMIKGIIN